MPLLRLVMISMLALMLAGCREASILSDLSQRDANEIAVVLASGGIDAKVVALPQGRNVAITVPASQVTHALRLLRQAGLPRARQMTLPEILPKDTWMASKSQEDARLAFGLGQEIAGTITQIKGVLEARVHVALAQKNAIGQVTTLPSASVLVRYDSLLLDANLQNDIRMLVANAIPGLSFDRVSVTMMPTGDVAAVRAGPLSDGSTTTSLALAMAALAAIALLSVVFLLGRARQKKPT